MGSNNYGNANITFKYKHTAKAENFNWLLRNITPAGIYSGGAISFVGNNLTIAPYSAIVNTGSDKATSITTVSPIDLTTAVGSVINDTVPYIIMRYSYASIIANFPDYYFVAEGSLQANDIIFGKAVFVGGVVNSIDYSVATKAPQYNKALQRYDIFCDTFVNGDKINTVLTSNLDENYVATEFNGGAEFYFSPTINRTADITAGALRQGTEVTFYNSGSFNLTITYYSTDTYVVTPNGFVKFKWNGARFKIINETRIGKIESGIIIPRGAIGLQGQLRNKDDLYKYAQTYYSSFWATETDWQDMSKLECCKFVEYSSTQYRLPDFRGIFARFAGTNSVLKTAKGTAYDGGKILSILLDMFHAHEHTNIVGGSQGHGGDYPLVASFASTNSMAIVEKDTYGPPRYGNQTAPVSVSLIPYIYYED